MGEISPDEKDSLLLGDKLLSQTFKRDNVNLTGGDDKGLEEEFQTYDVPDKNRITIKIERASKTEDVQEFNSSMPINDDED